MKLKCKPVLTMAHKQARLQFARNHMASREFWRTVVFSDEKKFNLDGPDGIHQYWHDLRKQPHILSKRVHGGGSVMVWAAFNYSCQSEIVFISGRMNSAAYQDMLQTNLLPFAQHIPTESWVYQQDNASIHRSASTLQWLESKNVNLLDWPSRSPDINPIENLWGLLVRKVYKNGTQFETSDSLKVAITAAWAEITIEDRKALIESMEQRIFDVIQNRGGSITY